MYFFMLIAQIELPMIANYVHKFDFGHGVEFDPCLLINC